MGNHKGIIGTINRMLEDLEERLEATKSIERQFGGRTQELKANIEVLTRAKSYLTSKKATVADKKPVEALSSSASGDQAQQETEATPVGVTEVTRCANCSVG